MTHVTRRLVYWQSAAWLTKQGLARTTTGPRGCQELRLTDAGRAVAAEVL